MITVADLIKLLQTLPQDAVSGVTFHRGVTPETDHGYNDLFYPFYNNCARDVTIAKNREKFVKGIGKSDYISIEGQDRCRAKTQKAVVFA